MNEIKVTKSNVDAAYAVADENIKKVLDALFGSEAAKPTPTLEDYTTIRSYGDACIALGRKPWITTEEDEETTNVLFPQANSDQYETTSVMLPKHLVALHKLEIISRALWGKKWEPKPDPDGKEIFWFPWFALYTESEIENLNDTQRGSLLACHANAGANCGFGFLDTSGRSSDSNADIGFRLCQETEEKAKYFGTQFVELWAEYLAFNFTTGERIK